ncbi:MAG: hypothetical protein A49_27000 [Methyloceanibacter sp.]|nr:MAG: hypothetical protein A49_27000 [Methyloceanibacter sp.]
MMSTCSPARAGPFGASATAMNTPATTANAHADLSPAILSNPSGIPLLSARILNEQIESGNEGSALNAQQSDKKSSDMLYGLALTLAE